MPIITSGSSSGKEFYYEYDASSKYFYQYGIELIDKEYVAKITINKNKPGTMELNYEMKSRHLFKVQDAVQYLIFPIINSTT